MRPDAGIPEGENDQGASCRDPRAARRGRPPTLARFARPAPDVMTLAVASVVRRGEIRHQEGAADVGRDVMLDAGQPYTHVSERP